MVVKFFLYIHDSSSTTEFSNIHEFLSIFVSIMFTFKGSYLPKLLCMNTLVWKLKLLRIVADTL